MGGCTETRRRLGELVALSAGRSADPSDPSAILCALLASSNVASKRWAFEQYDSVVGSRTARRPEDADAAVLMLPESDRAIAVAIDGNGRRVACDPYAGTVEAVMECAQNLACVGAEPLGLTNCLNFGNPEKPSVAWQLDRATLGLADACLGLRIPVVGGNVSLYNETEHGPIYPTPVVGMVGELPDPARAPGIAPGEGDRLVLVGPFAPSLAGSELAKQRGELDAGLPQVEIGAVAEALAFVRRVVRDGGSTARPRRQRRRPRLRAGRDGDRGRLGHRGRPRSAGRAAGRIGRELPLRRGAGRDHPGRLGRAMSTTSSGPPSRPVSRRSRSAASAGIGSRSRPPNATSPWRSPTRSVPGARCPSGSRSGEYAMALDCGVGSKCVRATHLARRPLASRRAAHPLRRRVVLTLLAAAAARGRWPC